MSFIKEFEHLRMRLEDIISATNNFSSSNYIGKGGFGMVYKGELSHSEGITTVAVKRLDRAFGQGNPEFWKEIMMLSRYKHENLISLLGFCDENNEKILVYEYAVRGSLDFYLSRADLTWSQRLKICIGAARGLEFLHNPQGTQQRVIHRDIKSSNILLDENWKAKISDFGLSKLGPANQQYTFLVSNVAGTFGYCDPLYMETGFLTKESDVYSFGVVLFEVLCGRLYIGDHEERRPLTGLVRQSYVQNTLKEIVFDSLKDQMKMDSFKAFTTIAYQCLKREREDRPTMVEILKQLELAFESQVGFKLEITKTRDAGGGFWNRMFRNIRKDGSGGDFNIRKDGSGGDFQKDGLSWSLDIGKYGGGEFSMAMVQANNMLEDQGQIESGPFGTFVGVYDGHRGPEASTYVCDNLFKNFQAASLENHGIVTPNTIERAFLETESEFTALVSQKWNTRPEIATIGTCCLVGVIHKQTLFVANLGDSRVVLGKKFDNNIVAVQLSREHNAAIEEVRQELKALHPHDPQIVVLTHNVWRVKGMIQTSRSIGDVYMKHAQYNNDQIPAKFRLGEPMVMPILTATPSVLSHDLQPSDSFLVFASDGLWEHLSNQQVVDIVYNNQHSGIAKRLVKAALQEAARKREMRYSHLLKIDKGIRRHFHDDITVIVLFLNYDLISLGSANGRYVSIQSESGSGSGSGSASSSRSGKGSASSSGSDSRGGF